MKLIPGYIKEGFPVMKRKIPHFRIFRLNRRNLSVYLADRVLKPNTQLIEQKKMPGAIKKIDGS